MEKQRCNDSFASASAAGCVLDAGDLARRQIVHIWEWRILYRDDWTDVVDVVVVVV